MVPEPLEDWEINSNPDVDRAEIEPSESSWDARSNARSHTPSGADSDEEDARTVMLELFPELASSGMRPPPDPPLGVTNDMLPSGAHEVDVLAKIATWVERIESGDHHQRRRRTQHGPPSIAPSVTSITTVSSLSTVRDFADEEHRKGTWMAPEDRPGGFSR
ncbi:hypothetical protein BD414DRAFT_131541 [Trametes punicea]|nr:hypothetical protein BD414DRAFT_131541 [Trametes punicea]